MTDPKSKVDWEAENVIKLTVKINKNQDPNLYELFQKTSGSKSEVARELLRAGLER